MFKPVEKTDSTTFVSLLDQAIDRDRIIDREMESNEDLGKSSLTGDALRDLAWMMFEAEFAQQCAVQPSKSLELLIFKDGATPTKFRIGTIPSDDINRIYDETHETNVHRGAPNQRFWRAFCHGLRDIEGWQTKPAMKSVGDVEYVDPMWIRKTFIRGLRKVAIQVGQIIFAWNEITEDEVKN